MKVAQGWTSLEGSQLVDALDHIALYIQVDQLHTPSQRLHLRDAVLREVTNAQPGETPKRSNVFYAVFGKVEHHKVGAFREGFDAGECLAGEGDGEDDFWRKFIGEGFEHGEGDLACEVVFFLAELGEVSELFDVDVVEIGSQQFGRDVVVLHLCLALFRHRYILHNSSTIPNSPRVESNCSFSGCLGVCFGKLC